MKARLVSVNIRPEPLISLIENNERIKRLFSCDTLLVTFGSENTISRSSLSRSVTLTIGHEEFMFLYETYKLMEPANSSAVLELSMLTMVQIGFIER